MIVVVCFRLGCSRGCSVGFGVRCGCLLVVG